MQDSCFLCGATENLTRDHIPPQNLFRSPRPTNLITVDCCKACNDSYSKDDEAFRLWVTTSIFNSAEGRAVWREKVVPSLRGRNKLLAKNVQKYLGFATLRTPDGDVSGPTVDFPPERGDRYLIRVTKGLLRYFHPEYDYKNVPFQVIQIHPTIEHIAVFSDMTKRMIHDERGNGVFRFWRSFLEDAPNEGMWILLFYGGVCFCVMHGHDLVSQFATAP